MREVLIVLAKVVHKISLDSKFEFFESVVTIPRSTSAITCDYQETTEIRVIFLIPDNRSPIQFSNVKWLLVETLNSLNHSQAIKKQVH